MDDRRYPLASSRSLRPSRRDFLKLAGASAAGLLAGCAPQGTYEPVETPPSPKVSPSLAQSSTRQVPVSPTLLPLSPTPQEEITPTAPVSPTEALPLRWPEIGKKYPDVPSRVVLAHHGAVWQDGLLDAQALSRLIGSTLCALTGMEEASFAWQSLFDPHERISIKVNTIGGRVQTHVALVMTVIEDLITAGVPAEQICIYDRMTAEIDQAGFPTNQDRPGVRCVGTDGDYEQGWEVQGVKVRLSRHLLDGDALINIPVLKQHGMAGVTFAMKNHYGSIDRPSALHGGDPMRKGLAELNALAPINERTRLIIGDILEGASGKDRNASGGTILMSFDPVAHDFQGLQILKEGIAAAGGNPDSTVEKATSWLSHGAQIGLGTDDPNQMERIDLEVS